MEKIEMLSAKIDMILLMMQYGFGGVFALLAIIWGTLWRSIGKLDEKLTDVDRRLCRMEGAFSMKECCRLNPDEIKKAG